MARSRVLHQKSCVTSMSEEGGRYTTVEVALPAWEDSGQCTDSAKQGTSQHCRHFMGSSCSCRAEILMLGHGYIVGHISLEISIWKVLVGRGESAHGDIRRQRVKAVVGRVRGCSDPSLVTHVPRASPCPMCILRMGMECAWDIQMCGESKKGHGGGGKLQSQAWIILVYHYCRKIGCT